MTYLAVWILLSLAGGALITAIWGDFPAWERTMWAVLSLGPIYWAGCLLATAC